MEARSRSPFTDAVRDGAKERVLRDTEAVEERERSEGQNYDANLAVIKKIRNSESI